MSIRTFKSVLHPSKYGYHFAGSGLDNWSKRGSRPVTSAITMFETYGDGCVQHSGDWCPQPEQFSDVCWSVAAAIVEAPREEWSKLWYALNKVSAEQIEFALGVKYREEGKRQWYSKTLLKVTTGKVEHDRRYERVESRH